MRCRVVFGGGCAAASDVVGHDEEVAVGAVAVHDEAGQGGDRFESEAFEDASGGGLVGGHAGGEPFEAEDFGEDEDLFGEVAAEALAAPVGADDDLDVADVAGPVGFAVVTDPVPMTRPLLVATMVMVRRSSMRLSQPSMTEGSVMSLRR